jgi:hypothetical protein
MFIVHFGISLLRFFTAYCVCRCKERTNIVGLVKICIMDVV